MLAFGIWVPWLDKEAIPCVGLIGLHCLAILQRSELVRFQLEVLERCLHACIGSA
jgi:hypothetical protein